MKLPQISKPTIAPFTQANKYLSNYMSFIDRQSILLASLKRYEDESFSNFVSFPIYKNLLELFDTDNYLGVYRFSHMSEFIGTIPEKNIQEIVSNIKTLEANPFINTRNNNLYVLAPMNNFAIASNVEAIDPIVFIEVSINSKTKFIPITQWENTQTGK